MPRRGRQTLRPVITKDSKSKKDTKESASPPPQDVGRVSIPAAPVNASLLALSPARKSRTRAKKPLSQTVCGFVR